MVQGKLLKFVREIYNISPFRKYFFYRYHYMFSPSQLCFFCNCVDRTKDLDGVIFEIGCAEGRTTVFLKKHMEFSKIKKNYICLDTFSGFTESDLQIESTERGKDRDVLKTQFVANKKSWVDKTIRYNGFNDVVLHEADINTFDLKQNGIEKIAFCLIDVDLYQPVKSALEKVYPLMTQGGIIVIDDCKQDKYYDGALQAYQEFIEARNIKEKIILEKLGIIET